MSRTLIALALLVSCADMAREAAPVRQQAERDEEKSEFGGRGGGGMPMEAPVATASPAAPPAGMADRSRMEKLGYADGISHLTLEVAAKKEGKTAPGQDAPAEPTPRSWFPESFLWMPQVETDASGAASVDFLVPDSLTTWRVLGLGWSAQGAQGGAVTEVLSTLPAYVDAVVPNSLYAGDVLELPVQVVNTTSGPLSAALDVEISGAEGGGAGQLTAPAGSSATRSVTVRAPRSGTATVRARFGEYDEVVRTLPVRPFGERLEQRVGGAVGGAAVPLAASTGRDGSLSVTVWPGALAVVREELNGGWPMPLESWKMPYEPPLERNAYRFALALAAAKLPEGSVSAELLRTTRLQSWQPLARAGRIPEAAQACLLAEALKGAAEGTLEGNLAERMQAAARQSQSADGTWQSGARTIDAVLIQSAACAYAIGPDPAVGLRLEGAFARNRERLKDPVLAAWALASGAVSDPELAAELTDTVKAAILAGPMGSGLPGGGTLRPDGSLVSDAEATAVAALALANDRALSGALAAGLLAQHQPWGGWGDGFTNLMALRALSAVFTGDNPPNAAVQLVVNGTVVAEGTLDASQPHKPLALLAPWSGEAQSVEVRSNATGAGLAWSMSAVAWGDWTAPPKGAVELAVVPPANLRVGRVAKLAVSVAKPESAQMDLVLGLPAGVRGDPAGLDQLVASGLAASWTEAEGAVRLRGLSPGNWGAEVPVVPSAAGTLAAGPSVALEGGSAQAALVVPTRWKIAP